MQLTVGPYVPEQTHEVAGGLGLVSTHSDGVPVLVDGHTQSQLGLAVHAAGRGLQVPELALSLTVPLPRLPALPVAPAPPVITSLWQ